MPLFVDTDLGRFYVCCKPCYKKVLADLPTAHKTAYPVLQEWKNEVCPMSGEPIGADAVPITLQGHRFMLCCTGCVAGARAESQVALAKITQPKTVDVGNTTCPVSGKATVANAFVRIDDHVVRLSSSALAADAAKDPAAVLAKARAIAKAQPPKPPHQHQKATEPTPATSTPVAPTPVQPAPVRPAPTPPAPAPPAPAPPTPVPPAKDGKG
jgi:hypothetical protein